MSLNQPISDFKNKNIWLIGASSGIGAACAKWFFAQGANLVLSARRTEPLEALAKGVNNPAYIVPIDVCDQQSIAQASKEVLTHLKRIDLLLFVSGVYEPVQANTLNYLTAKKMVDTNLLGPISVLEQLLPTFLAQQSGHIAIVGSVAGYSGLPKSLVYGPTKAAILNFAESLYMDLSPQGIGVHVICPGFVSTPATAINDFKMPALISADEAAKCIGQGLINGDFEIHFPKRFSRFLKFLRILPYPIYFWLIKTFIKI